MKKEWLRHREPKKYEVYQRLINSYKWQLLRRKKFLANPVCEDCAAHGRVAPTEEVHHIIPVEDGKDEAEMRRLAYDIDNLASLCKSCHAARHAPKLKDIQVDEGAKTLFSKIFGKRG